MIEFIIRFVFFTIFESPKFHMGKGRDDETVRIVHEVARRNGKTSNCRHNPLDDSIEILLTQLVTVEDLQACGTLAGAGQTDAAAAIKRRLAKLDLSHVKALS